MWRPRILVCKILHREDRYPGPQRWNFVKRRVLLLKCTNCRALRDHKKLWTDENPYHFTHALYSHDAYEVMKHTCDIPCSFDICMSWHWCLLVITLISWHDRNSTRLPRPFSLEGEDILLPPPEEPEPEIPLEHRKPLNIDYTPKSFHWISELSILLPSILNFRRNVMIIWLCDMQVDSINDTNQVLSGLNEAEHLATFERDADFVFEFWEFPIPSRLQHSRTKFTDLIDAIL